MPLPFERRREGKREKRRKRYSLIKKNITGHSCYRTRNDPCFHMQFPRPLYVRSHEFFSASILLDCEREHARYPRLGEVFHSHLLASGCAFTLRNPPILGGVIILTAPTGWSSVVCSNPWGKRRTIHSGARETCDSVLRFEPGGEGGISSNVLAVP